MFLLVSLSQKLSTSMALIFCGLKDPNQRHWGLVCCGTMLQYFATNQFIANMLICGNSSSSGESLFTTFFRTFTLLLVADLDDKLMKFKLPASLPMFIRVLRKGDRLLRVFLCFSPFLAFLALPCAYLAGAIYIAINDLHYSEFTVNALSWGTDLRDFL